MSATDPGRLRRSVRVAASLTAVLGALVAALAGLTHGLVLALDEVRSMPGVEPVPTPPFFEFVLAFAVRSTPYLLALGAAFLVGGVWARLSPREAPAVLRRVAELGVLGSLALGALWCVVASEHGADGGLWLVGIAGHGLQAALIARAWVFLGRPDVRAAALSPADG